MSRARLLALALILGGCDAAAAIKREAAPEPARVDRAPRAPQAASAAAKSAPTPRPRHALRVRAVEGGARDAGWQVGAELPAGGELVVARGAQLSLALDDHVSLRVQGPARLLALPEGEPALLVREGLVTVDCAPRAARTTASAFWLADANARVDVVLGARFVWRSEPLGPSALSVVSGNVELVQPASGGRERAAAHASAGAAPSAGVLLGPAVRCLGGTRDVASAPAPDLARAERALAALSCGPAEARPQQRLRALAERLRAQLELLASGSAREQALLREHALRLREGGDAGALRAELSSLAGELMRERTRARSLRSMWEAARPGSGEAAERELAERARVLAPYSERG